MPLRIWFAYPVRQSNFGRVGANVSEEEGNTWGLQEILGFCILVAQICPSPYIPYIGLDRSNSLGKEATVLRRQPPLDERTAGWLRYKHRYCILAREGYLNQAMSTLGHAGC